MPHEGTNGLAAGEDTAPRFRAAEDLLQSAARMIAIECTVATLDPHGPPAARCFVGRAPLKTALRIGLFSGSFNPLTDAHVAVADAARTQAQLDALVWAEPLVTVDKERVTRASLPDRLAQLVAFVRPRRDAVALLNRGLYVEQVRALRTITRREARIFVVVGFDKVVQIFDRRYYANREAALTSLFAEADLLASPRGSVGASELAALLDRPENRPYAEHVTLLDVPGTYRSDSSTEVRQLAADAGAHPAELERLVPPEALALIATQAYVETDAYPLRLAWLAALRPLPAAILAQLPPLAALVALVADDSHAQAHEALLDAAEHPSAAATVSLLRALGMLTPTIS